MTANLFQLVGVGQRRIARQIESPVRDGCVELIQLSIERSGRRFKRLCLAQRNIAGGPVGGHLARIDLVSEIAVDHPARPRGRTQRYAVGAAARNSGNEPVGMAEVEARIESQCHDRRCRVRRSLAGENRHFAFAVHAQGMISGGERVAAVEMVALHPVLQLARSVAGVVAHLKHGDHDYLHRDGPWFRSNCIGKHGQECASKKVAKRSAH